MFYIKLNGNSIVSVLYTTDTVSAEGLEGFVQSTYINDDVLHRFDTEHYEYLVNGKNSIEVRQIKEFEVTHEELTKNIYRGNEQVQDDNLLNMEISTDTNARTMVIGDDSLLLMEMLLTIDEKLNQLVQPK